jgi:hypothetical protein
MMLIMGLTAQRGYFCRIDYETSLLLCKNQYCFRLNLKGFRFPPTPPHELCCMKCKPVIG